MLGDVNFRAASLVGLILIMILAPLSSAETPNNELELRVEITEPSNGLYYSDTGNLDVTIRVKNHATQVRELVYNPACPFDLEISGDTWEMNLNDERICPTQSRAMSIQPGQERILSTWTWDWSDAPSGELEFEFAQNDAGIHVVESLILQRTIEMPENLKLDAILAQTIGDQVGHTTSMPAMIYLSLSNLGTDTIEIPFHSNCRVETDILTDLSCGSGTIEPGEKLPLGWATSGFEDAINGDFSIPISLSGVSGSSTSVDTFYSATPVNSVPHLESSLTIDIGEQLEWHFALTNTAQTPAKLMFDNLCVTETHVISPSGEIVFDTRGERFCPDTGIEHKIDSDTTYTLASDYWDFIDTDGCEIGDGLYLLVVTQPDHSLVSSHSFSHEHSGENPECGINHQDGSEVQLRIDNLVVLDADGLNERVSFEVTIVNMGTETFDFYWPMDCSLELELALSGEESERVWYEGCDAVGGQRSSIAPMQIYSWPALIVHFGENGQELPSGNWQISVQTTSIPAFGTQLAHTYDGVYLPEVQEDASDVEETEVDVIESGDENPEAIVIDGDWDYVTTATQGCWLLKEADGGEHSFITHIRDGGWTPQPGLRGSYVVETSDSVGSCSAWSGIVILETLDETDTAPEIFTPIDPITPSNTPADEFVELAPVTVTVLATTSLSLMSLLYLGNTEWIRIPALQFGIGLVGMVRRNGEHDGEYQRGRIMGYLTANPGVHFRALLGALNMSNGQLTHHLKHLQGEERIWRRKDGRLVRFYPATIRSTLDEDELPIPLLTPDPNSLQGKILRLLDATENDIVNLSQKELAVRLKASQQLISHHLRTLEKFGLVEREKVGMRYRYQLTREAIFLVNSNEYDIPSE
ncbi:MAG: hypothetical protein VYA86_07490 [Candidatus Thermoplasmatota archaeon]|nr:hypothetical protein [Candidatus Thermoplasmatota archaeon]